MNSAADQTAIVLSGGGAYGAFAVGIMKALFAGKSPSTKYEPLEATIFSGTSVGAFNAVCMVMHANRGALEAALKLEHTWLEQIAERPGKCGNGVFRLRGNPESYLEPSCLRHPVALMNQLTRDGINMAEYMVSRTANFWASSETLASRITSAINLGALIDAEPFQHLVNETICEEKIRNSPNRLTVVATNWSTGAKQIFSNSDFVDGRGALTVMASAAIPGIFPPVRLDGDIFVDGGVVENTPLKSALEDGATSLHVIYLDPEPGFIPLLSVQNSLDTFLRVYYLMLATKISEDVETARWINEGLNALAEFEETGRVSGSAAQQFARVAGQILGNASAKYRPVTIHRYFPTRIMGGDFGMLDFGMETVASLIHEGEEAAELHDCLANRCVIP